MYIYQADTYCDPCGVAIKEALYQGGLAPVAELRDDSGSWPQGPFEPDESDTPQHCGGCGEFLDNPLTEEGVRYVAEALIAGAGDEDVLDTWADAYAWTYDFQEALDMDEPEALQAYAEAMGDPVYALVNFPEAFRGIWQDVEYYADQLIDDLGILDNVSDTVSLYFDLAGFARDLVLGGDIIVERLPLGEDNQTRVAIFDAHV